jgi:hypothetical protein
MLSFLVLYVSKAELLQVTSQFLDSFVNAATEVRKVNVNAQFLDLKTFSKQVTRYLLFPC